MRTGTEHHLDLGCRRISTPSVERLAMYVQDDPSAPRRLVTLPYRSTVALLRETPGQQHPRIGFPMPLVIEDPGMR